MKGWPTDWLQAGWPTQTDIWYMFWLSQVIDFQTNMLTDWLKAWLQAGRLTDLLIASWLTDTG